MTKNFNQLIDEILKDYNYEQVDIKTLKSYFVLLYHDIKLFFDGHTYEIVFNNKLTRRKYAIDMCSFLSIMEIQNKMLEMGLDLHYSLYLLSNKEIEVFNDAFSNFVEESDVYKLNEQKSESVYTLKLINNLAEKYLLDYFENK